MKGKRKVQRGRESLQTKIVLETVPDFDTLYGSSRR